MLHIWLRPQIEQRHTINKGARPHIEATFPVCEPPHITDPKGDESI
jgi:hypothetical protein